MEIVVLAGFSLKPQQSSSLRTHSSVMCILNMIKMKKSYFIIAALVVWKSHSTLTPLGKQDCSLWP